MTDTRRLREELPNPTEELYDPTLVRQAQMRMRIKKAMAEGNPRMANVLNQVRIVEADTPLEPSVLNPVDVFGPGAVRAAAGKAGGLLGRAAQMAATTAGRGGSPAAEGMVLKRALGAADDSLPPLGPPPSTAEMEAATAEKEARYAAKWAAEQNARRAQAEAMPKSVVGRPPAAEDDLLPLPQLSGGPTAPMPQTSGPKTWDMMMNNQAPTEWRALRAKDMESYGAAQDKAWELGIDPRTSRDWRTLLARALEKRGEPYPEQYTAPRLRDFINKGDRGGVAPAAPGKTR